MFFHVICCNHWFLLVGIVDLNALESLVNSQPIYQMTDSFQNNEVAIYMCRSVTKWVREVERPSDPVALCLLHGDNWVSKIQYVDKTLIKLSLLAAANSTVSDTSSSVEVSSRFDSMGFLVSVKQQ